MQRALSVGLAVGLLLGWTAHALAFAEDMKAVAVRMTADKKFVPAKVTIKVGQTVEWIAADPSRQHSVTTDPSQVEDPSLVAVPKGARPFTSGLIEPGKSFKYRFTVPGTYKYVCPPHEQDNMTGEVVVTP